MYDLEYFERMLRQNAATAEQICRLRWKWIEDTHPKTVLDYGSGCGFFRAWRPPGVEVFTYDICPQYPQTGMPLKIFDVTCLWDTLEHIGDFKEIEPIFALSKHLAITVPIKPPDKDYAKWKHSKPSEHVRIFTESGMDDLVSIYGFKLVRKGTPEVPPRTDITSFLYKKVTL